MTCFQLFDHSLQTLVVSHCTVLVGLGLGLGVRHSDLDPGLGHESWNRHAVHNGFDPRAVAVGWKAVVERPQVGTRNNVVCNS